MITRLRPHFSRRGSTIGPTLGQTNHAIITGGRASDSRSPVYLPQGAYQSPFLLGIRNDLRIHERTFWRLPQMPQMWKLSLVMFD